MKIRLKHTCIGDFACRTLKVEDLVIPAHILGIVDTAAFLLIFIVPTESMLMTVLFFVLKLTLAIENYRVLVQTNE